MHKPWIEASEDPGYDLDPVDLVAVHRGTEPHRGSVLASVDNANRQRRFLSRDQTRDRQLDVLGLAGTNLHATDRKRASFADGRTGFARYRFSYASKMPGSEGKPVVFEGTSHFVFRDGLIQRYSEVFDRGLALVQQDFAAERIKRVLVKTAEKQNAGAGAKEHLARLR